MSGSHSAAPRPDETNRSEPQSASQSDDEVLRHDGGKKFDWGDDRAPIPTATTPAARRVITRDFPDAPAPSLPPAPTDDFRERLRAAKDLGIASAAPMVGETPAQLTEQEKTKVRQMLRASTFRWISILGVSGFVVGTFLGGWYASRMGYDARLSSLIGVLIGTAVGAAGMMLPPLFRAIGWGVLAAAMGGVGASALFILNRVAPALVERFLHFPR